MTVSCFISLAVWHAKVFHTVHLHNLLFHHFLDAVYDYRVKEECITKHCGPTLH